MIAVAELRKSLLSYEPADRREASHRERMLALLDVPRPFERSTFLPGHFTASAFVLSPERDAIVLIWHKKLAIWVQPGGHVEPGDASLFDAAQREAVEEVGASIGGVFEPRLLDLDVHSIPARPDEPAHEHFDVRYLFTAGSRQLAASEEVGGAKWVPLTGVDALASDESVRRAVRKICGQIGRSAPSDAAGRSREPLY